MKKLINDTLKSPNGKWSRKSLTMFSSFFVCVILGTYIVISNYVTKTPIANNAIDVFQGFLLLVGALSGITVWDKQSLLKTNNNSNTEE
jgi:hypothetical protein|tara:strand:+ start:234 stop:500 length:267 start_codon:yes stop_codon:yes gene_type:complete